MTRAFSGELELKVGFVHRTTSQRSAKLDAKLGLPQRTTEHTAFRLPAIQSLDRTKDRICINGRGGSIPGPGDAKGGGAGTCATPLPNSMRPGSEGGAA
jgi:hypothetical protein